MREMLKQILAGRGTPVLQTWHHGEETILSAGNIWTSAHTRRIELRDGGLVPGTVLCSDAEGFQAVIDFVACAIGGFVYFPATSQSLRSLMQQTVFKSIASSSGIAFVNGTRGWQHHPDCLPASLAAIEGLAAAQLIVRSEPAGLSIFTSHEIEAWLNGLSTEWGTPEAGTRLSYIRAHHDFSFVTDLLLGLRNRQTIYLRNEGKISASDMLIEILELGADDLVLSAGALDKLDRGSRQLGVSCREGLRRIRCHIPGRMQSSLSSRQALRLFDQIFFASSGPVGVQTREVRSSALRWEEALEPAFI